MLPGERIRRLVVEGKISPDEGARLLGAIEPARAGTRLELLWNPFERFGGGPAALAGLGAVALGVAASRLGIRFDGAFDLHVASSSVALRTALADQLVAWPLPALGFWLLGHVLGRAPRLVDHLGAVAIVRFVYVLFGVAIAPLASSARAATPSPALAAMILLALTMVVWAGVLLFFGFRSASGLRGARLGLGFALGIVVIEVVSKFALAHLAG